MWPPSLGSIMQSPGRARLQRLSPGRQVILLALCLGLVVGLAVSPFAYQASLEPSPNEIAVVPIVGTLDGQNSADVIQRLTEARMDSSVDAVVLVISSPGGLAVAGDEIFMQVDRTAQEKPVIAVADAMAASAAYKAAVPADEIYVKPHSMVGSVGSIFVRPDPIDPSEPVIHTGPHKLHLDTPRGHEYASQRGAANFLDIVMEYRGDELTISEEELAHARVYLGTEAVQYGLADDIADLQGGIQAAAELAELDSYTVRTMGYESEVRFLDRTNYAQSIQENKSMIGIDELIDSQDQRIMPQVLMLPHAAVVGQVNTTDAPVNESEPTMEDADE